MPRFPRNPGEGSFGREGPYSRRPKPRPAGFSPQRFDKGGFSSRPRPAPRPAKPAKPPGPARIAPIQPASGKQRRRMVKAAAWRLAQLLHVRPADVLVALKTQPRLDLAFPNRSAGDRISDAA